MAYLSSALTEILHDLGWKQKELADRTDLPASQINRYMRGKFGQMPVESAQNILKALPEKYHSRFLVAYLRDCLPSGGAEKVEILARDNHTSEGAEPPTILPGLDRDLDRMLRQYAHLATQHPEIRDMLRSFLDALGVSRPEVD